VSTSPKTIGRAVARRRAFPVLPVAVFSIVLALAISPNIVNIYGIHNDYEMLVNRSHGLFHPEAGQLLSVARPMAALLTNLPIIPLRELSDWRWVRLFSLLTACVAGAQLIAICINRLCVRPLDAVAIACATFLSLPYIYSILQPAAWAPHLLTTLLALGGYAILSRTNIQALAFIGPARRFDYRSLWQQALVYANDRTVWRACILFQLAMYGYPPNALILLVMPVIAILFSRAPHFFRTLVAARDIVFIAANLVAYLLFTKLVFLPVVRLFVFRNSEAWRNSKLSGVDARIATSYEYAFNTDLGAMFSRLKELLRVAADLWFPPQYGLHLVVAVVVILAAGLASLVGGRRAAAIPSAEMPLASSFDVASWRTGLVRSGVVIATCLAIAASPIVAARGGFVTYRTMPVLCALMGIVFLYGVAVVVESTWRLLGGPPRAAAGVGGVAVAAVAAVALLGNFQSGYMTMLLSRNEYLYFQGLVQQALTHKVKKLIVIDPRPFILPEEIPTMSDQKGRAVPPFELGCLSSYCLQTGAIMTVVLADLGRTSKDLETYAVRAGTPIWGLTCDMLTAATLTYPTGASEGEIDVIKFFRDRLLPTCVTFTLDWHDLSFDLGAK
jgi:hypothetical protein